MESKERMTVELLEDIKGEKLKKFINFCFDISDAITLKSGDTTQMLETEMKREKDAFNKYLEEDRRSRREEEDDEEEDDEENGTMSRFAESNKEIDHFTKVYLSLYGLSKREVTYKTHCTWGSPVVVYQFGVNDNLKNRFEEMNKLFREEVILNEEKDLGVDDPAFYKGGELVCSICSHEGRGHLVLDEDEYNVFRTFRIPHQVISPIPSQSLSLEEWLEECAYQEREKVTILGWDKEVIPEQLGKIKTLKELEIFDHGVTTLPKSLQELTNLECLRITDNKVEALGFELSKLTNLKTLDFGGMPLKVFPKEILELKQLERIYIGCESIEEVPEELIKLEQLQVLSLPSIGREKLSPELIQFIERLEPKSTGISLREILGEEKWAKIVAEGSYITINV